MEANKMRLGISLESVFLISSSFYKTMINFNMSHPKKASRKTKS